MKTKNIKHILLAGSVCCIFAATITSCSDVFDDMEGKNPSWLGENIYDYLKQRGDCQNFLRLIDDDGLTSTMQLTGSNTVFFANDDAFNRFYQNNTIGIHSYEQIPQSLKKLFLRFGVIENAQLIERLSQSDNGETLLRRTTNMEVLDTVPQVEASALPDNEYFANLKKKGQKVKLLQDGTQWTLVQFFPNVMKEKNISDEDFQFITKSNASTQNAYLYSTPITQQDIVCKNGYLHELNNLLLPPENMAGYIRSNEHTQLFRKLLDRFCLPVYYGRSEQGDSIWEMRYFNTGRRALTVNPVNKVAALATLIMDPGWNLYASPTASGKQPSYEQTMACMFVPTDEALNQFFSETGEGADFYRAFGTWDNVPTSMVADILNAHMKNDFLQALPSKFATMEDENGYAMNVDIKDINDVYIARNGLVYETNKVYAPQDYKTVMGPTKIDIKNSIFNTAISNTSYSYYAYLLRAPKNTYYFFVTPDEKMKDYVDPVTLGYTDETLHAKLNFYFNSSNNIVATPININTGDTIRSTSFPMGATGVVSSGMSKRMNDILGTQTIVASYDGELEARIADGQEWFVSNSYAPIHIKSLSEGGKVSGTGNNSPLTIQRSFHKSNGHTYEIDGILQNTTKSIYDVMKSRSEFSEFFNICEAIGAFSQTSTDGNATISHRVSFLNQYHYTVYVPTNEAIRAAQAAGKLPTVSQWENEGDAEVKEQLTQKLLRFVRYHFQDNSVFIHGKKEVSDYLSATLNNSTSKFYPIHIENTGSAIKLTSSKGTVAHVVAKDGLYNLTAHDIVVNNKDKEKATEVAAYAYAVLHQIDKVMEFE